MPTAIPPLAYGTFYHIYNRGDNRENIFFQERNYACFLNLWWKHTCPIAETWAYCLLRNHFHAVVRTRNREDLTGLIGGSSTPNDRGDTGPVPSGAREAGHLSQWGAGMLHEGRVRASL